MRAKLQAVKRPPAVPVLPITQSLRLRARKGVKYATCFACRDDSGPSNGHWRGGQTRHRKGYVMIRTPGHPRASTGHYVFEHVLVMEQLLGRYLQPGENVHH